MSIRYYLRADRLPGGNFNLAIAALKEKFPGMSFFVDGGTVFAMNTHDSGYLNNPSKVVTLPRGFASMVQVVTYEDQIHCSFDSPVLRDGKRHFKKGSVSVRSHQYFEHGCKKKYHKVSARAPSISSLRQMLRMFEIEKETREVGYKVVSAASQPTQGPAAATA